MLRNLQEKLTQADLYEQEGEIEKACTIYNEVKTNSHAEKRLNILTKYLTARKQEDQNKIKKAIKIYKEIQEEYCPAQERYIALTTKLPLCQSSKWIRLGCPIIINETGMHEITYPAEPFEQKSTKEKSPLHQFGVFPAVNSSTILVPTDKEITPRLQHKTF
ncbi:MAG: hypothetical protein JO131_03350 [Gammaproteobacteria bacterium]|nr:hypothetical protein [Gammaproteobacteria bacterium]